MTLSDTAQSVDAFFESYRAAFERLDASAIADHFAYPSHITSDAGEVVLIAVGAKQEWIGTLEHLLAMYRRIGFSTARILDLAPVELSPRVIQVLVRWALYDASGRLLYDFPATYTLARMEDTTLRISAIAHSELPRYRECLARLGRSP